MEPARRPDPGQHPEPAPADTRERLLDAGEGMFASRGYAATSVRDITSEAGCNLAAINYHFGSKHNLYREVFRRRLAMMRQERLAAIEAKTRTSADLASVLRAFAEAFVAPLREQGADGRGPLRLMMREFVDPMLPRELFHSELIVPVNRALVRAVTEAAPDLDQRTVGLCVQSFVAQLLHLVHTQNLATLGLERPTAPFTVPEVVEHIVRFTVAAIERIRDI